jgi:hypothetical protein
MTIPPPSYYLYGSSLIFIAYTVFSILRVLENILKELRRQK